jgi:hypothetical protein
MPALCPTLRTRLARVTAICIYTTFALATDDAWGQPALTVDRDVVVPGTVVTATVTGVPGQHFALVGSSVGAGASHAGVALSVGGDLVILAVGVIDGTGRATVGVTPPFRGTMLDRFYIQAATSSSAAFASIDVSAGKVLRNADLVAGVAGVAGPPGPPGPQGPQGPAGSVGPQGHRVSPDRQGRKGLPDRPVHRERWGQPGRRGRPDLRARQALKDRQAPSGRRARQLRLS